MKDQDFEAARLRGIIAEGAKGFMAYDSVNGHINVDPARTAKRMAMDAAPAALTTPNVGFPAAYYQYLDPRVVEVLFGVKAATRLAAEIKMGDWTTDYANFPVEEITGDVTPYSDFADNVSSEVNYEFPVRELFRFQTVIHFGDLEADKAAAAKIALASRKQYAAAEIIARKSNRFYLFGVKGKQIYGLLNDPNLNASISPISVSGKSTWADKIAADPNNAATLVFNDINKLISSLFTQMGGNVDANSELILGISNGMAGYLSQPNQYGKTALEMARVSYPGLTVVQIPELSTASGEILYLIAPSIIGVESANTAYGDKFRLGRLIPETSSFKQKAVGTTFGAIIRRPAAIARMLGV